MTRKDYELIAAVLADVKDSFDRFAPSNEERLGAHRALAEVTLKLGEALLEDNSRFDIGRFAGRVGYGYSILGPVDTRTGKII